LIRAKESMNVTAKIPTTNDALRFKLEINSAKTSSTSKEFRLAAAPPPTPATSGSVKPADAKPGKTSGTLTLISLECTATNDDSDTDRLELRFYNGNPSASGVLASTVVKKGQVWKFGLKGRPFDTEARVELWEIDHEIFDKDDKLGWVRIRVADGFGPFEVSFTPRPGTGVFASSQRLWKYTLRYRVDP
jgi:hypothetical protein